MQKPKRIARTVFFDGEVFTIMQLTVSFGGMISLADQLKDEATFSLLVSENATWLILFGDEDVVEQLYTVFKEIADSAVTK